MRDGEPTEGITNMSTSPMTSRQRVKAAINFQETDRLACSEDPWPDTTELWRSQGLPDNVSLADYFDFDLSSMFLDCSPRFEHKIISRDDPWYTYQDRWGYTATKKLGASSSVHFFDHKTTDRNAWDATKHRWAMSDDPQAQARIDDESYFEHHNPYPTWAQARHKYDKLYASQRYMLFHLYGPYEASWRHCGYESMLMNVALEPDWAQDMGHYHIELTIDTLKRCIAEGIKPDGFFMVDDLAGTRGLLFSPDTWRELYKPLMTKLGTFLTENDIDFWMHSCGNPEALFADLIDCGVQVINPLQASTGLNVVDLRRTYGKNLAFYGNICVTKMSGPIDELEQEIEAKVSLGRQGGYIFHSDHSVPPDVSFERYKWIIETARKYADAAVLCPL